MRKNVNAVIDDDEHLLRTAFSPMHFNHKGKLRPSCLKPMTKEPDEDDPSRMNNKISVTRLDYAGWNFCLTHAKSHQSEVKKFKGFLKLLVGKVRNIGTQMQYKPTEDNPFHANIVFPEIDKPHEDELDELETASLQATMRKLLESGEYVSDEESEELSKLESLEDTETIEVSSKGIGDNTFQEKRKSPIMKFIDILKRLLT